jgi:hypothetical protein
VRGDRKWFDQSKELSRRGLRLFKVGRRLEEKKGKDDRKKDETHKPHKKG